MWTDDRAGRLPGEDLLEQGLSELKSGAIGEAGLLVLAAGPRLRRLGIEVPEREDIVRPVEHRLYEELEVRYGKGGYSRYNALIRRMVSLARALEREHTARMAAEER